MHNICHYRILFTHIFWVVEVNSFKSCQLIKAQCHHIWLYLNIYNLYLCWYFFDCAITNAIIIINLFLLIFFSLIFFFYFNDIILGLNSITYDVIMNIFLIIFLIYWSSMKTPIQISLSKYFIYDFQVFDNKIHQYLYFLRHRHIRP